MSRILPATLVLVALALGLLASPGYAFRVGVGGFGLYNYSLDDPPGLDFHSRSLWGLKAKTGLLPFLGVEGMVTFVDYGEFGVADVATSGSLAAWEVNGLLGTGAGGGLGLHFYYLFGVGAYSFSVDPEPAGGKPDTRPGWNIGTGMEIVPWPNVGLDGSLRLRWINTEGSAVKDLGVYAGVNYYFGN